MAVGRRSKFALNFMPVPVFVEGALGVDVGPGSDGVLVGIMTPQAIGKFVADDGGSLTDETTGANNATTNDMHFFPAAPAVNDACYFGQAEKFCGLDITIGTKMVAFVGTVVWEYFNGSAWATLTPTLDESSALIVDATGAKKMRFVPPADWAPTTLTGITGSLYYIRARISAFTSVTTVPLGTRVYAIDLTHGTGLKWSVPGALDRVQWNASTVSGSTADSKVLAINLTKGTCGMFTLTKATATGQDTSPNLGISQHDQIAFLQIAEDGSTEFADVQLWAHMAL